MQYSSIQQCTVQYTTVQYSTVQYSTVQYSKVQCKTGQLKERTGQELIIYLSTEGYHQGCNVRKVNCGCVYSAYILKPVLSGRNL